MANAIRQHKLLAEGKSLQGSPSGIAKFKKGGAVKKGNPFGKHDDAAMDKKLVKGMVKKGCVK